MVIEIDLSLLCPEVFSLSEPESMQMLIDVPADVVALRDVWKLMLLIELVDWLDSWLLLSSNVTTR